MLAVAEFNVVIVGVGGQGILTLARLIGEAAVIDGVNVMVAETHGLSQRGGSVLVHVRLGDVEAPLIPLGGANLMLALELLEALRYLSYMRGDGVIVADKLLIPPSIPDIETPGLEVVVEALESTGLELHLVPATIVAEKLGDVRVANTYMLGYAYARTRLGELLSIEAITKAIQGLPNPDLNLKAFNLGLKGEGVHGG